MLKEQELSKAKKLVNEAVVLLAQAAEAVVAKGNLTTNQLDAKNLLNEVIVMLEDEIIPTLEVAQ